MTRSDSRSIRRPTGWWGALLAVVVVFLFFFWQSGHFYPPSALPMLVLQRLLFVGLMVVILGLCALGGMAGLRVIGKDLDIRERICFGSAIGLGWVSLSTLAFGVAGLTGRRSAGATLGVLLVAAVVESPRFFSAFRRELRAPRRAPTFLDYLLFFVIALVVLLGILCTFVPPMDYDVVEYHLAAPRIYFDQGRITYLPNLVFSNFPFNMEMLYLFGMSIVGKPLLGAYLAKLFNLGIACLLGLAIYSFARRFLDGTTGKIAIALFASCPFVFNLASVIAYVTTGWSFFSFLAFYALIAYLETRRAAPSEAPHKGRNWIWLCGIATGLAMGVKYPAYVFVLLPLACVLVAEGFWRGRVLLGLRNAVLYVTLALCLAAPWLVKNYVYTGNPVYPLAYGIFGARNWSPEREARWHKAHSPKSVSVAQFAKKFKGLALNFEMLKQLRPPELSISIWILPFLPAALLALGRNQRVSIYVFGYFIFGCLTWFFFTHQIPRFLVPYFPFAMLASAAGLKKLLRGVTVWVIPAALGVVVMLGSFVDATRVLSVGVLDLRYPKEYFKTQYKYWLYPAIEFANRRIPPGEKILSIGEATSFYFPRNFIFATVFDLNPLDEILGSSGDQQEAVRALSRRGIKYIFVNYSELERLQRTYQFDFNGPRWGYSDLIRPELFRELRSKGLIRAVAGFGGSFRTTLQKDDEKMLFREPYHQVFYQIIPPA